MKTKQCYIPHISEEVDFQNMTPFSKEKMMDRCNDAEKKVITNLLIHLLKRIPTPDDYEYIELVDSIKYHWIDVFYCDVRIGKLEFGGKRNLIYCLLTLRDIYVIFVPEKQYRAPENRK
ncbi:MAG: hypothetical protein ACERKD_08910 [Prolixibacteraceae bacterium]